MDAKASALTASCAAAPGIGAGIAMRLMPAFRAAYRNWSGLRRVPDAPAGDEEINITHTRRPGRVRNSSIIGLYRSPSARSSSFA